MTACCSSGTSTVRRGIIPLVVCSVLGAAAFVGGDPSAPARPALDPAVLFPSGTPLMMTLDGGPCAEFGKELAISRIWNEPEVQDFAKSAFELVQEMVDTNVKDAAEGLGITPEELRQLARTRLALGVTRFEMPKGGDAPRGDLMLAMDLRGQQKAMEAVVKLLEKQIGAMGAEPAETTVGGVPGKKIAMPPDGPFEAVTYLFHDGWLIAGTDTAQLEAAITRAKSGDQKGSLASDPKFASAMKEVVRPKTIVSFYVDYAFVIDLLGASSPAMKQMMAASGLEGMKTAAYGMDLDGASFRERMFAGIAPDAAFAKLQVPMDASAVLARVPKRSFAAYAASMNFKEYFEYFRKMMTQTAAVGEEMEKAMAQVDKFLGANWREELLPNLGPEFAMFAAMPQYGMLPDIGVLVKVGDRSKIEAAIARMLDRPRAKAAHRTVQQGAVTINYLDLGVMGIDRELNLRPAYVFVDDYFLVALSPHSAKSILSAMAQKDGGLLAREDFSRTFGRLKAESPNAGNLAVAYFDAQWFAGFVLDSLVPIVQSGVSPDDLEDAEPLKIDLGKIPSTQSITKHLSGIVVQGQTKEGGNYTEFVSPVGVLGASVGIGAVGGLLIARVAGDAIDTEMLPESRPGEKDEDR